MSHINSQEHIKSFIIDIESKFEVDKWNVNSIDVWPYIRIKLYYLLLTSGSNSTKKLSVKKETTKVVIKSSNKYLRFIKCYIQLQKFYASLQSKPLLFFGSAFHRVKEDGLYFNRFFDTVIKTHQLENDYYFFEHLKYTSNYYNQKAVLPLSELLTKFKEVSKLTSKFNSKKNTSALQDYNIFLDFLKTKKIDVNKLKITSSNLEKWSSKISMLERFYITIYKKVKPSKVILLSYYGFDDLYSAISAANKLNIRTIDFQHGPQTNVHMAYSNWTKVPKVGFNIMPVEYWNWDKRSKENIDSWANNTIVKAKVFGQPYVSYCMQGLQKEIKKKYILYSLQTDPISLFTPQVISLIKNSNLVWVLRLHPRNNTNTYTIKEFLNQQGIQDRSIIQSHTETSLPEALSNSVLHVTNYSGCVIEALMMQTKTIIIHKVGFEMFVQYIDNVNVFYLNPLSSSLEQDFFNILKDTIVSNPVLDLKPILNPLLF